MQSIIINQVSYNIPVSWDEVTYSQSIGVIKNVNDKGLQLTSLTGIPIEIINKLEDRQAQLLFELISFTENLEVFDSDNVLDEYKDFDFGSISYGDAESCRNVMKTEQTGFESIIPIMKILFQIDISDRKFLEIIGTVNFFLSKLIISLIVTPNLTKITQHLNSNKLELSDSKNLAALERMLNLQGVEQSEIQ